MRLLPKLSRLSKLEPIDPVDFDSLVESWKDLLWFAAKRYSIPGKLEPEDVFQEICVVAWNLSRKFSPKKYPVDYRKLLKTEIFNKAIDMVRFHKTKKRLAFSGWVVECHLCGNTSSFSKKDLPVCPHCGHPVVFKETTDVIKWKQDRPADISLNSEFFNSDQALAEDEDEIETPLNHPQYIDESFDNYLIEDLKKEFDKEFSLETLEYKIFYFLLEPTEEQRLFLRENDLEKKKRISYKILATYFQDFTQEAVKKSHKNMSSFIYGYLKNDN